MMKLLLIIVIAVVYTAFNYQSAGIKPEQVQAFSAQAAELLKGDALIKQAFEAQKSNLQVQAKGVVVKVLPDDNEGSRHQRFILKMPYGGTVLLAHNIDLAGRVANVQIGDEMEFSGEYEWNAKGGVVHWTHHDPQGHHQTGWLRHQGKTYQ